jgi:hypothetical protein
MLELLETWYRCVPHPSGDPVFVRVCRGDAGTIHVAAYASQISPKPLYSCSASRPDAIKDYATAAYATAAKFAELSGTNDRRDLISRLQPIVLRMFS